MKTTYTIQEIAQLLKEKEGVDFTFQIGSSTFEAESIHKVGNVYKKINGIYHGKLYYLCNTDANKGVSLLPLEAPNQRWYTPYKVQHLDIITQDEWSHITNNKEFKLMGNFWNVFQLKDNK